MLYISLAPPRHRQTPRWDCGSTPESASPRTVMVRPSEYSFNFRFVFVCAMSAAVFLLSPGLVAQSHTSSLNTAERNPPPMEGLRARTPAAPIGEGLRPDQRGDIFMARKVYRSAVDAYQQGLVEITTERAEVSRLRATSLRELDRESEARAADADARQLEKKSKELAAQEKLLPGSSGNFLTRLLAALGIVSNSPPAPSGDAPGSMRPSVPWQAGELEIPEGLSQRERAEFLARSGRHDYALATLDSLAPALLRRHAVLWNKIGIAYHQMLDMDAAGRCYRESVKTDGHYAEARNNLGTVHYTQKQFGRAIAEYKKSLEVTPNSASVHSNLGTAYFSQKRYEQASVHYSRAVEIDPMIFEHRGSQGTILQQRNVEDRASFHFYLSKVYARNGDFERSLIYMRRALEEGFKDRRKFRDDSDFAELQELEEFQTLLATEFRVL